jgi:AbrB family looped-hinge helix DNA binding protein
MKVTIDRAGRLVIPKELREQAGIGPGTEVKICYRDGHLEIEPETLPVRLVRQGRFLVAVPLVDVPPLTNEIVEQTLDQLRRQHEEGL